MAVGRVCVCVKVLLAIQPAKDLHPQSQGRFDGLAWGGGKENVNVECWGQLDQSARLSHHLTT